jgi:transcriptional regulator with XRE-family HTH domain
VAYRAGEEPKHVVRLRVAFKVTGMSQNAIAKKAGVAPRTISNIVCGNHIARHDTRRKIMRALGIPFQGHRHYFG